MLWKSGQSKSLFEAHETKPSNYVGVSLVPLQRLLSLALALDFRFSRVEAIT